MSVHSRRGACGDKVPHRVRSLAQLHADSLNERYDKPEMFSPYDCRWCGFIHVGRIGSQKPSFPSGRKVVATTELDEP